MVTGETLHELLKLVGLEHLETPLQPPFVQISEEMEPVLLQTQESVMMAILMILTAEAQLAP